MMPNTFDLNPRFLQATKRLIDPTRLTAIINVRPIDKTAE